MKRKNREVRKAIFSALSDGKEHSYGELERKVNTNYQTIRDHIEYIELFGAVEISKENRIKITEFGRKILRKIIN
jgi:predicted transcriptional regulator